MQATPFDALPVWLVLALLVPIAGYCLRGACNVFGVDPPPFRRSVVISALVAAAAFFTFDGLGYGLVLGVRDITHLVLPPDYGYPQWLREPLYLKWQVMGLVPVLRYLPVVFAVCLASILYVILLKDTYRVVIVVFLAQWVMTLVVATVVAFALTNVLGLFHHPENPPDTPPARAATRPSHRRQQPPPEQPPPHAIHGSGATLKDTLASYQVWLTPFFERVHEQLDAVVKEAEPYLEPMKEATAPYTRHLPEVVQEFLDDGGWLWVLAGLTVTGLLGVRSIGVRFAAALRRRKKRRKRLTRQLRIDLREVSGAFTEVGPNQITVRSFPGRLRVVVMAPASSYVGDLLPEMAESLLDWIRPGLGAVFDHDHPRVVVWPRMASEGRFFQLLAQSMKVPGERGRRSPWISLSGTAHLGRQRIYLAVAVHLDEPGYMREIVVEKDKWDAVLGIQPSPPD